MHTRAHPATRPAVALLVALMSVGGASACSPGPSEGFKQLEGTRLTVEYPQDWKTVEPEEGRWNLMAKGEDATVRVADPYDNSRVVSGPLGDLGLAGNMTLQDFDPGSTQDLEVEGADSAAISTFHYSDDGEPAQGAWIVVGQDQPGTTVAVQVMGTEVDEELIGQVKESLVYEHSDVAVDTKGKPKDGDA